MFLKRHVQTRLDFLKPDITGTVRRKYQQKEEYDNKAIERQFDVDEQDEQVYLHNAAGDSPRWILGVK